MSNDVQKVARVKPRDVRYIKLGPGGVWENAYLDGDRIDWGISPSWIAGAAHTTRAARVTDMWLS